MLLGVFSDAHGNLRAFNDAINCMQDAGVQTLRFLGDAVGYIPDIEALQKLYESGIPSILGNHEDMLLKGGYKQQLEPIYQLKATRAMLTDRLMSYLDGLPEKRAERIGERWCLFVHGSPDNPVYGYVYPDTDLKPFVSLVEGFDAVFMGNTHRPFVKKVGGILFVNVGSCGLPRGEDLRGAACVYDSIKNEASILHYDSGASARAVLAKSSVASPVKERLQRMADF